MGASFLFTALKVSTLGSFLNNLWKGGQRKVTPKWKPCGHEELMKNSIGRVSLIHFHWNYVDYCGKVKYISTTLEVFSVLKLNSAHFSPKLKKNQSLFIISFLFFCLIRWLNKTVMSLNLRFIQSRIFNKQCLFKNTSFIKILNLKIFFILTFGFERKLSNILY